MSNQIELEMQLQYIDETVRALMAMRGEIVVNMQQQSEIDNPWLQIIPPRSNIPPRANTLPIHQKVIKKSELNEILTDACGICLDQHTKGDTITCNCGHDFGQACFDQWKQSCQTLNKNTSCPTCRAHTTKLTGYRQRAKR